MENNPVKTKNLNNLTSQQFSKLVQGIKNKKFRVVSWQGTILMDLLEYAQRLVARGGSGHDFHMAYLKSLSPEQLRDIKIEIKTKTEQTNRKSTNTYLLVGRVVLFHLSLLASG